MSVRARRSAPRAKTLSLRALKQCGVGEPPLTPEEIEERPRTRGDCAEGPRPCPWVGCRYHLFLDVKDSGHLRLAHPGKELEELRETCALDVAARGEHSFREIGELVNLTNQAVLNVQTVALARWPERGDTE